MYENRIVRDSCSTYNLHAEIDDGLSEVLRDRSGKNIIFLAMVFVPVTCLFEKNILLHN